MQEATEELVETTGPTQPRMIDIVASELHDLQQESLLYRKNMDEAKTKTKRVFYKKKLKKSNKKMMNMLVAFEKLRGREADTSHDAENLPEPELPEQLVIPEN